MSFNKFDTGVILKNGFETSSEKVESRFRVKFKVQSNKSVIQLTDKSSSTIKRKRKRKKERKKDL